MKLFKKLNHDVMAIPLSGFNTTTTNLIMESAARKGSSGYVEGFTGNGFVR
jgi:hypothetical protein